MCIDKLDNTVNKHNNIYHKTTKMKPVDLKTSTSFFKKRKVLNF